MLHANKLRLARLVRVNFLILNKYLKKEEETEVCLDNLVNDTIFTTKISISIVIDHNFKK